jgi:hypothetical protein
MDYKDKDGASATFIPTIKPFNLMIFLHHRLCIRS